MFHGSITALITPFRNGAVDEKAFAELVEWQIAEGAAGLVPCGTTGESPTLSHDEHKRVVEICVGSAAGRVPVIAGTGSNSTAEAIELTRHAKQAGADAALVVMPYYNKPTPEGQYRHFKAINDAVDLPVIIYNIPGRSVVDMSVETMARLAKLPNMVGVKDATADLVRPLATRLAIGPDFCQLSGEDATVLPFLAHARPGRGRAARWRPRPRAGMAASPSPPTSPRGSAPTSTPPGARAISAGRSGPTKGCCRCTRRCSSSPARAR